jgi:hypothetical protein
VFVIALAKGRLLEKSLDLLGNAGILFAEDVASSRKPSCWSRVRISSSRSASTSAGAASPLRRRRA